MPDVKPRDPLRVWSQYCPECGAAGRILEHHGRVYCLACEANVSRREMGQEIQRRRAAAKQGEQAEQAGRRVPAPQKPAEEPEGGEDA